LSGHNAGLGGHDAGLRGHDRPLAGDDAAGARDREEGGVWVVVKHGARGVGVGALGHGGGGEERGREEDGGTHCDVFVVFVRGSGCCLLGGGVEVWW